MKATKRWIYLYRATVKGSGTFPLDMLRYDRACPATERDSGLMEAEGVREVDVLVHSVNPRKYERDVPTVARWESFGWKVVKVEAV